MFYLLLAAAVPCGPLLSSQSGSEGGREREERRDSRKGEEKNPFHAKAHRRFLPLRKDGNQRISEAKRQKCASPFSGGGGRKARKNGDSSLSLSLSLSLSFSYSHFSNVSRDHGYIIKRIVVPIQRNIQSLFFLSFSYSRSIRVRFV